MQTSDAKTMKDEGELRKAYGELEKWEKHYQKLKQRKKFLNTSLWKSVSKLPVTTELLCNQNDSSTDKPLVDLVSSYSASIADSYGDGNYYNSDVTEDSYSGSSLCSEIQLQLHENASIIEPSRHGLSRVVSTTKLQSTKREKLKHETKPAAVNPYLNFLRRLEQSESERIMREQFQQEVSELSRKFCDISTDKKLLFDDKEIPVVEDEEEILRLLSSKRRMSFEYRVPFNIEDLRCLELDCKRSQPQLTPSNQLAAFFLDKPKNKHRMAWYVDCKEWFKPTSTDQF